jgi:hypothetical protein
MRSLPFAAILSLAALTSSLADEPATKNPLRISVTMEGEGLETSVEIEVKNAGASKILVDKYLVHGLKVYFDDEFGQTTQWHTLSARPKDDKEAPPDENLVDKASLDMSNERFVYLEPGASLTRKLQPFIAYAATRILPAGVYSGKVIWKEGIIVDRLLFSDAQLTKCYVTYVGIPNPLQFDPFPEDMNWKDAPQQEFVVTHERHFPHRRNVMVTHSKKETADSNREEIAKKFERRAAKEEIAEFDAFIKDKDPSKESRILELLLGKLNERELDAVGITEVGEPGALQWAVAWSNDSAATINAIQAALKHVEVVPIAMTGRGSAGWYVNKADFFKAQAALNASPEVRACGVTIVKPKLSLR